MELEEYLKDIKNCPEELVKHNDSGFERDLYMLTTEFGIYDNYPILLKAHFDTVLRHLSKSGKYNEISRYFTDNGDVANLEYIPGTVSLQLWEWPWSFMKGQLSEELIEKLEQNYNMTIILQNYQKKKMENTSNERALALIIEDLAQYIKQEKIPACFPKSQGWNHLKDDSRIVYFEP